MKTQTGKWSCLFILLTLTIAMTDIASARGFDRDFNRGGARYDGRPAYDRGNYNRNNNYNRNVDNINRSGRYYYNGNRYNYYHNGNYYNYYNNGAYYRYYNNGAYYNYFYNGRYYNNCNIIPGYWLRGIWVPATQNCW